MANDPITAGLSEETDTLLDNVLQLMEIDGSCQTKVSVPVNTELYIIVPVRQKSRYNQLSLYQIRKIEIYLSSCKH